MRAGHVLAILLGVLLVLPEGAGANASGYHIWAREKPFERLPLEGGTAQSHPGGSSVITGNLFPPDFEFEFFGETKREVYVDGNGYLTFTQRTTPLAANQFLPNLLAPDDLIAPFWDDLITPTIKTQVLGEAPRRIFVVEWVGHRYAIVSTAATFEMQVRLYEGSSVFEIHYGKVVAAHATWTGSMGFEDSTGRVGHQLPSASTGGRCGNNCTPLDWPEDTFFVIAQGPELVVDGIELPAEGHGGVGLPMLVQVSNLGGVPAENLQARIWLSPSPALTEDAIELTIVDTPEGRIGPEETLSIFVEPRLPVNLEPFQTYYIIIELDPFHEIPLGLRQRTISEAEPFVYGLRAPNLFVEAVGVPDEVRPGETVEISWTVQNRGNLEAVDIPYRLLLGRSPHPSPAAIELDEGHIAHLGVLEGKELVSSVDLPTDLPPGLYHVGVEVDPWREIFEHDRHDNHGVSAFLVVAADGELEILTKALPKAHWGGAYNVRLEARGGDGSYSWSTAPGSTFPPGISLVVEEPPHGSRATFLRGVPSNTGSFDFTLAVRSGRAVEEHTYSLEVSRPTSPLAIASERLASAAFGFAYEERLQGMGGTPPYDWSIARGRLPEGVLLRPDGLLEGSPTEEGAFFIGFRLLDAVGKEAEKDFRMDVAPPLFLRCLGKTLPSLEVDDWFSFRLPAAGGSRPYEWETISTIRIATEPGEEGKATSSAPPGLRLEPEGHVMGALREAGAYVWNVRVRDADEATAECPIHLHAPRDRGLTVISSQLPNAIASRRYEAHLVVEGGDAPYTWRELGTTLEELGLTLEPSGKLVGTPRFEALEGESRRRHTITVLVTDSKNRLGVGAVGLTLAQSPPRSIPKQEAEGGGCQAGGRREEGFALSLALAALFARRRSRLQA